MRVEHLQLLNELLCDATVRIRELQYDCEQQLVIFQTARRTDAMALLSGESAFSVTIDAMDSTDDTRECDPKGRLGAAASRKGSGACLLSRAMVLFALSKKLPKSCRTSLGLCWFEK